MKKFLAARENEWILPLGVAILIVVIQVLAPLTPWANHLQ